MSFLDFELKKSYLGDSAQMDGYGDEEFRSCREYRTGDSIRHIDWAGWARSNKAIVKEYEDRSTVHISLILDNSFKSVNGVGALTKGSRFEFAVSLMAGITSFLSKQNVLIDNLVIGDDLHEVSSEGQSELANEEVQKHLANCEYQNEAYSYDYSENVGEFLDDEQLVLYLMLNENKQKLELVEQLKSAGKQVKVLCLGDGEFNEDLIRINAKKIQAEGELRL